MAYPAATIIMTVTGSCLFVGYYDMEFGLRFRRRLLPPSSALKMEAAGISLMAVYVASLTG
jgi:hypothetical protein